MLLLASPPKGLGQAVNAHIQSKYSLFLSPMFPGAIKGHIIVINWHALKKILSHNTTQHPPPPIRILPGWVEP